MGRRSTRATLLSVLLLGPVLLLAPQASAATVEPAGALPDALVGASAVTIDGVAFVAGGRLADGNYSDAVLRFDAASGTASRVATLPASSGGSDGGRQSAAAVSLGGVAYVFGGATLVRTDINGDGVNETIPRATADIVAFDPATGQARTLADRLPRASWGLAAVGSENVAYLFGGFSFDMASPGSIARLDTIVRFDAAAPEGQRVRLLDARLPFAAQDAGAAIAGGSAYLFGGLADHDNATNPCPDSRSVCVTDAIVEFGLASETTVGVVARLPERIHFAAGAASGGVAYLLGGRLESGDGSARIYAFDPAEAPTVRLLSTPLPQAVFGAAATPVGASILAFGGRTGGLADLTDAVARVRLDEGPLASAPRDLRALVEGASVALTWRAPAYEGGSPVASYRVYRDGALLAETNGTSFTDAGRDSGAEHRYMVAAVNAAGEGDRAFAIAIVPAPPLAPRDLVATAEGDLPVLAQRVDLAWRAPASDGGSPITEYRVYRADAAGNFVLLGTAPADNPRHVDESPPLTGEVRYHVRAVNAVGEGAPSPEARVDVLMAGITRALPQG